MTAHASSVSAEARAQILPRPVFCITRDVHNDRSLADHVCAGRFTHAGLTLDLGIDPDWLGAELPADEEWRIEWNKFYYGLDLANAFRAHGHPRFLRTWESLVHSWIKKVPVGSDSSDVAARRMQNWTYAWSLFASSRSFSGLKEGMDAEILSNLSQHALYVRQRLTPDVFRNHRTLELYALFVVALAFPQIDPSSELLRLSITELHRTLLEGFRPDGVHRENSTHYHLVVLRSLLGARENARRFALELPDGFDGLLERACEFALHCHRPDGVICALSDADAVSYREVLELAGVLLDRPDFTYAATEGARGTPSSRRYVSFPSAGYFFQRSGWGAGRDSYSDERFLAFDCGPIGEGGHGHYDLLNVEMYGHGRPLIVDPGRFTYSEEGSNLRHWFKGTAAHNTVCVDDMDQTPYRRGSSGKQVAIGRPAQRKSASGLDVLEGRAVSPLYDAVHTRRIFFVGDDYWIVEDQLEAELTHRYDLRWHLSPEAWPSTEVRTTEGGPVVLAPGLALAFAPCDDLHLEPGWVSPRYGVKEPAPVVKLSARGSDVRFLTVVTPLRRNQPAPRIRVRLGDDNSSGPTFVHLEGIGDAGQGRDAVAWSRQPSCMRLGSLECTAKLAWLRESPAGRAVTFRGYGVIELAPAHNGLVNEYADSDGWVAWDLEPPLPTGRGAEL